MQNYNTDTQINAANVPPPQSEPQDPVPGAGGGFQQESTAVQTIPTIYQADFSGFDPSQQNYSKQSVINSISGEMFNNAPDPSAGSIVAGTDANGRPMLVFMTPEGRYRGPSDGTITVPNSPSHRPAGYSCPAIVLDDLPPHAVELNVRSPDNSFFVETVPDPEDPDKVFYDLYGMVINGLKADENGTEILMVSEDNSLTIATQGKKIDLKANIPKIEAPDNSIEVSFNEGANKIDLKGTTVQGHPPGNVVFESPNKSVQIKNFAGQSRIELNSLSLNDMKAVPVTLKGAVGGGISVGNLAKADSGTIELAVDIDVNSPDQSVDVNEINNVNGGKEYELRSLTLNGIKAQNVLLSGEEGTKVETVGNNIIIKGGGLPEGYEEQQISLCINGIPHTAYILMKGLQPA